MQLANTTVGEIRMDFEPIATAAEAAATMDAVGHNTANQRRSFTALPSAISLQMIKVTDTYMQRARCYEERIDRYLHILGNGLPSSVKAAWDISQDCQNIIIEADRALQTKISELEHHVDQVAANVCSNEREWYRKIEDITGLYPYNRTMPEASDMFTAMHKSELWYTLDSMPILDVRDFAAYLEDTLPAAAMKEPPVHDVGADRFVSKVRLLLDWVGIKSTADYSVPMRLLVVARAKVLRSGMPRLKHVETATIARCRVEIHDDLTWLLEEHSKEDSMDRYWDFAACWRQLVYSSDYLNEVLLRLLDDFRAKAEQEIRRGVDIAVRGRLPAELADAIMDAAMLVEEIPWE